MAISICLIYWCVFMLGVYIYFQSMYLLGLSPAHFVLSSIVSCNTFEGLFYLFIYLLAITIAILAFFRFPFAWNAFYPPLTFSLYMSLDLKWICYRRYIYRLFFCIYSEGLCLLVEAFNLFTFNYQCVCSCCHFVVLDLDL